jgi:hypothetical protein
VTIQDLRTQLPTGTLIFSQGDCLAVKVFTASSYTHVAAIVVEDGGPVVYDAMNGPGVRKSSWENYVTFLTPSEVEFVRPARPLTDAEAAAFSNHLRSQLGRPYRIHHHVTGQRCDGVHCAEYVTDALIAADWITARQPSRVSPGSLLQGVRQTGLYMDGPRIALAEPEAPVPADETWCQWTWRETAACCSGTCRQLSRWFLCRSK